MTQMLIFWNFRKSIRGRTKRPRGPRVCDPAANIIHAWIIHSSDGQALYYGVLCFGFNSGIWAII